MLHRPKKQDGTRPRGGESEQQEQDRTKGGGNETERNGGVEISVPTLEQLRDTMTQLEQQDVLLRERSDQIRAQVRAECDQRLAAIRRDHDLQLASPSCPANAPVLAQVAIAQRARDEAIRARDDAERTRDDAIASRADAERTRDEAVRGRDDVKVRLDTQTGNLAVAYAERDGLRGQLVQAETQCRNETQRLGAEVARLQNAGTAAAAQIASDGNLRRQMAQLEEVIVVPLRARLAAVNQELATAQSRLAATAANKPTTAQLQAEVAQLADRSENLRTLAQLREQVAALSGQRTDLATQNETLAATVADLRRQLEGIRGADAARAAELERELAGALRTAADLGRRVQEEEILRASLTVSWKRSVFNEYLRFCGLLRTRKCWELLARFGSYVSAIMLHCTDQLMILLYIIPALRFGAADDAVILRIMSENRLWFAPFVSPKLGALYAPRVLSPEAIQTAFGNPAASPKPLRQNSFNCLDGTEVRYRLELRRFLEEAVGPLRRVEEQLQRPVLLVGEFLRTVAPNEPELETMTRTVAVPMPPVPNRSPPPVVALAPVSVVSAPTSAGPAMMISPTPAVPSASATPAVPPASAGPPGPVVSSPTALMPTVIAPQGGAAPLSAGGAIQSGARAGGAQIAAPANSARAASRAPLAAAANTVVDVATVRRRELHAKLSGLVSLGDAFQAFEEAVRFLYTKVDVAVDALQAFEDTIAAEPGSSSFDANAWTNARFALPSLAPPDVPILKSRPGSRPDADYRAITRGGDASPARLPCTKPRYRFVRLP